MRRTISLALAGALALVLSAALLTRSRAADPVHPAAPSRNGNMMVTLCDGETSAEIPGVHEGERPTREQAADVARRLMDEWRRKNPGASWDDAVQVAQAVRPGETIPPERVPPPSPGVKPAPREGAAEGAHEAGETQQRGGGATAGGAGGLPAAPQGDVQSGHTYGAFSERDERIWAAETDKFVKQGHAIFHDATAVGSANAVSCDMCHPDASNTHPETYPKFQVQLGRVALLRDMINWCIQNPSRGRPLPDDDPKLKAIEAYILAQRKGTPLEYGKH